MSEQAAVVSEKGGPVRAEDKDCSLEKCWWVSFGFASVNGGFATCHLGCCVVLDSLSQWFLFGGFCFFSLLYFFF